ncbi:MAG: methyltransferase domain-containing protein [Bacillota bacterium]|nr:methyltransferase domain-containing protein [Bacillota bacterium]
MEYYSSGEFARKAHVTQRTIRYYDAKNILKPSFKTEAGARFYTDEDLARLQQILLLKYLGFALDDIREITLASADRHFLLDSLLVQRKLVEERAETMHAMMNAIDSAVDALRGEKTINWESMLDLIHMTAMERSLKTQYQNATNIASRIRLHHDYSVNRQGWFAWVMEQCGLRDGMKVLEIGCGNGALWSENTDRIPDSIEITLSDISDGMLRDAKRALGKDRRFHFRRFDGMKIPYKDESFDLVIANHVLFYCDPLEKALGEIARVLTKGGRLVAGTYGRAHMREITTLVQEFNPEIVLAAEHLYDRFGLENGGEALNRIFRTSELRRYEDAIEIADAEPLIAYILSCHGNQNRLLLDRYKEFHDFVNRKVKTGFHITKDAGVFLSEK